MDRTDTGMSVTCKMQKHHIYILYLSVQWDIGSGWPFYLGAFYRWRWLIGLCSEKTLSVGLHYFRL